MTSFLRLGPALLLGAALACAAGPPEPAPLDTRHETCAACRMAISDARFAAQIVAPDELPRFFDDLACLRRFLDEGRAPRQALVFVSDHRTKAWVRAESAVYTRVPGVASPMGSQLLAHADDASRALDEGARGGTPLAWPQLAAVGPTPATGRP